VPHQHKTSSGSDPFTFIETGEHTQEGLAAAGADPADLESGASVFFINDENWSKGPLVEVALGRDVRARAILDSGSEVNLIAQNIYDKLVSLGIDIPTLPLENVVLVTAFGKKSNRVKRQALIPFAIGTETFETNFFVSPQLINDAILGCQFMRDYGINLNFERGTFTYAAGGEAKEQTFYQTSAGETLCSDRSVKKATSPTLSSTSRLPLATPADHAPLTSARRVCNPQALVPIQSSLTVGCFGGDATVTTSNYDGNDGVRSADVPGELNDLGTPTTGTASDLNYVGDVEADDEVNGCDEVLSPGRGHSANNEDTTICCSKDATVEKRALLVPRIGSHPQPALSDARSLTKTDLRHLVEQNANIDESQKERLFNTLIKYLSYMSERPGKCHLMKYKFHVENTRPIVGYSRPIPFAVRPAVREQIAQMVRDDILEVSNSPFLNPLTVVHREGRKPRICVDARKVNEYTIPDHERTAPLQELLQRFEGASCMSSIDLSSAYLQIELHEESRKYTAFLIDSTVYQYKRVPYGFKNSLSAFVRALKLALGRDSETYVVFYVDDILVFSKTFEEHLTHLDTVIGRLTKAGFTLNAANVTSAWKR
jgi:hypothetical protein